MIPSTSLYVHGNPGRFRKLARRLLFPVSVAALVAAAIGLYGGLFVAPADFRQGDAARIIYIHVPSAFMASGIYAFMCVAALVSLIWRHPLADVAARCAAPIGATITLLAMITGAIWGQPMWGTWWTWDARLTSVFILFIMYLGLIGLWQAIDDAVVAGRLVAILTLFGSIILPIIKFSVEWWNTLHQPAGLLRLDGSSVHQAIAWPLWVMLGAFALGFVALLFQAMLNELTRRRIQSLQRLATQRARADIQGS